MTHEANDEQSDVTCFQLKKKKKKNKNKPEYKKPHKNTTKTNIKTHQEYKGGDQIYMEDRQ